MSGGHVGIVLSPHKGLVEAVESGGWFIMNR
jgi:hypothetical protein